MKLGRFIAGSGCALLGAGILSFSFSELPPELPGNEVRYEALPVPSADTVKPDPHRPVASSQAEKDQKTWDAPPVNEQMEGEASFVPVGKGGIFVPRMTSASSEPKVAVLDSAGRTVVSGEPGRTFSVEPGSYSVVIGSGAHEQRIIRKVKIDEGITVPIAPDWAGLSIETVDSLGVPFRGQYELLRIDEFESYGQGYGAKPELGEVVKTWIIEPGVYKLLGVGQSYNSLTGFVTVRLLPGELCRFLLVQDSTFRILGGGTVDVTPRAKLTSAWKYGASLGGNIKFNAEIDRVLSNTVNSYDLGLLSTLWLSYRKDPYDWQTRIRLNEGFNFSGLKIDNMLTDADDFLLNSLYIWRIFSWLGPYANTQIRTSFVPRRVIRDNNSAYFCQLDANGMVTPATAFDSSQTHQIKPSFSPFSFDFGAGLNADALNFNFIEAKIRGGFGGSYSFFPSQFAIGNMSSVKGIAATDTAATLMKLAKSIILVPIAQTSEFDIGPQLSLSGLLRLGRVITADGEVDVFAPMAPNPRLTNPNVNIISNISWRLTRWISLDYSYTSQYQPPQNGSPGIDLSTHWAYLRFSYSSR